MPLPSRAVAALGVALFATACGGSTDAGTSGGPPPTGSGGTRAGGSGGTSGAGGDTTSPPPACALTFTFTTLDNQGRYSPRNVSAVWVTDPSNAFLRTLEENGRVRQIHLVAWEAASSGSTADAVTGATNGAPRTHEAKWDCTDANHAPVLPGTYTLNAEFATDNGGFFGVPAPALAVPVDIGGAPSTSTAPDAQFFTGIQITYE